MKKLAIVVALAMAATASFGLVNVSWETGGFLSGQDASVFVTQDSDTTQLLWDLVYTSADSISTPVLDTKTGAISYGSDEVLSSRLWKSGSTDITVTDVVPSDPASETPLTMDLEWSYVSAGYTSYVNSDYSKTGGGIYSAVFQYLSNGDVYYAVTPLETKINWSDPSLAPDAVHFDLMTETQIATKLGTIEQPTQVPEPATMSLLGLGALAMVLRRKLRK